MLRRILIVLLLLPVSAAGQTTAPEIESAVQQLARTRALWPGFEPLTIPLAIYDGKETFLFRHPAPPQGFTPAPAGGHVYLGRHAAVTSNSSADLGGVATATVLADGARTRASAAELAAVALHESFHVFQRAKHRGWVANEADLLIYPFSDAQLLALRRLESEALRRALGRPHDDSAACWARVALRNRRSRHARMDSAFAAYERLNELNEGLATYVQIRARGESTVDIPAAEFKPDEVRLRSYTIGPALALLLDRFHPDWRMDLEANDRQSLDLLLQNALQRHDALACDFEPAELAAAHSTAAASIDALLAGWSHMQNEFDRKSGWRIVLEAADGQPLWPQNFDPLNLQRVPRGLLHTRWLHLGNDAGQLRIIDENGADIDALTEAAGAHPLFNGVRRVTIAGVGEPALATAGGRVTLKGAGINAEFTNATATRAGSTIHVRLTSRD